MQNDSLNVNRKRNRRGETHNFLSLRLVTIGHIRQASNTRA